MDTTVIGVGNPDCGDDAAGVRVIEALGERVEDLARVVVASGEPGDLIDKFPADGRLILVDAMAFVSECGAIHRFDASDGPLDGEDFARYSTHGMGLHESIEMARVLGLLPPRVVVYGIEGLNFEAGEPMSAAVEQGIPELANRIEGELINE